MTLMSRHNIDFIAFDFTAEDLDGLALDDPFAELGGHRLGLVGVEIQLLSDLFIGEVQAHEVEAEDPDPQWLVMTGEDGAGQVIEELLTGLASVALACRLGRVMALLGDPPGRAVWTSHPLGPATTSGMMPIASGASSSNAPGRLRSCFRRASTKAIACTALGVSL